MDHPFRSAAFGGFNRQDVLDYLEKTAAENAQKQQELQRCLEEAEEDPLHREGYRGGTWVLLDYGSVIVHVFTQEAHDYYDLEHLWADATVVPASEWMPEQPEDEQ